MIPSLVKLVICGALFKQVTATKHMREKIAEHHRLRKEE
jgi:hypothetical protein